jgi:hypothetical protein
MPDAGKGGTSPRKPVSTVARNCSRLMGSSVFTGFKATATPPALRAETIGESSIAVEADPLAARLGASTDVAEADVAGICTADWHFGHLPRFPANSSPTLSVAWHWLHLKEIAKAGSLSSNVRGRREQSPGGAKEPY